MKIKVPCVKSQVKTNKQKKTDYKTWNFEIRTQN